MIKIVHVKKLSIKVLVILKTMNSVLIEKCKENYPFLRRSKKLDEALSLKKSLFLKRSTSFCLLKKNDGLVMSNPLRNLQRKKLKDEDL